MPGLPSSVRAIVRLGVAILGTLVALTLAVPLASAATPRNFHLDKT